MALAAPFSSGDGTVGNWREGFNALLNAVVPITRLRIYMTNGDYQDVFSRISYITPYGNRLVRQRRVYPRFEAGRLGEGLCDQWSRALLWKIGDPDLPDSFRRTRWPR